MRRNNEREKRNCLFGESILTGKRLPRFIEEREAQTPRTALAMKVPAEERRAPVDSDDDDNDNRDAATLAAIREIPTIGR